MSEIEPKTNMEIVPLPEAEPSSETLSQSPRVVIYGQTKGFYGGATELGDALETYLGDRGMSDERVVLSRITDNIEESFYRGRRAVRSAENVVPTPSRGGRLRRMLGAVSLPRSRQKAVSTAEVALPVAPVEVEDSIPSAVFVFPKMREYWNGNGSTVDTPVEKIRALCLEHGVPMVIIGEDTTQKELTSAISELPPLSPLELE